MWRNSVAFGRPWRTGYSLLNEQTAFSFHNIRSHFLAYATGLQGRGLQLFVAFGLAGIVYLVSHSDRDRRESTPIWAAGHESSQDPTPRQQRW